MSEPTQYTAKPIFLHAVNRELHSAVGLKVSPQELLASIRMFSLISEQGLFCNVSQVQAVFYDYPEALVELTELSRLGAFVAHSDYGSMDEYRASRSEMFLHAEAQHPEYFSKPLPELLVLPLGDMGANVETTKFIESGLRDFVDENQNYLSDSLASTDSKVLYEAADWLVGTLEAREKQALTFEVFGQSRRLDARPEAEGPVRRALSQAYIGSYATKFSPSFIWGYSGVHRFEKFELFTGLNLAYAQSIFRVTGLDSFLRTKQSYGQFDRMNSFHSQELSLFRKSYHDLATYLDRNVNPKETHFSRNGAVRTNIQTVLETGLLQPVVRTSSFKDVLMAASAAMIKTRAHLIQKFEPIGRPKLYHMYPTPVLDGLNQRSRLQDGGAAIGGEYEVKTYKPWSYLVIAGVVSALLAVIMFTLMKWVWDFPIKNSAVSGIFVGMAIFALALIVNPSYFYRRIVGTGLVLITLGGWDFQFKLNGEDLGVPVFIDFGTGSSIGMILAGVATMVAGLIADLKQRHSDT